MVIATNRKKLHAITTIDSFIFTHNSSLICLYVIRIYVRAYSIYVYTFNAQYIIDGNPMCGFDLLDCVLFDVAY